MSLSEYPNKKEYSMEYQVSTSMLSCMNNTIYTIIRFMFALWTWIVLGFSLYYHAVPEFETIHNE